MEEVGKGETGTGTIRTGTGTDGTASDINNTGTGKTPDDIVVTESTVSVHCQEEGCIGKYIPRGPRNFPRTEGCKILVSAKSLPEGTL